MRARGSGEVQRALHFTRAVPQIARLEPQVVNVVLNLLQEPMTSDPTISVPLI